MKVETLKAGHAVHSEAARPVASGAESSGMERPGVPD